MSACVLVVDDSVTLRKVVRSILENNGYTCLTAEDGLNALEVLAAERVDLVLLDFVMPRMNGYQFCRELRSIDALRELPVVLMSAKAERIRDQFLRQTGAVDAITKPFDARGLVAVVEGALQRATQGRIPPAPSPAEMPLVENLDSAVDEPGSIADEMSLPILEVPDARSSLAKSIAKLAHEELSQASGVDLSYQSISEALQLAFLKEPLHEMLRHLRWLTLVPNGDDLLYGDIAAIPIGEALQFLQMQRQTGILEVSNHTIAVYITLREGLIDLAQIRYGTPEFLLGRYFLQRNQLTDAELHDAVTEAARAGKRLGDYLVDMGLVSKDDLLRALNNQTSEMLYEVLRWTSGWFLLRNKEPSEEARAAQLGLPVAAIVMEGFRRVDEWRLIEKSIDFEDVLFRDEGTVASMPRSNLTEDEQAVLDAVDGRRTVREIIEDLHQSSYDVCKTFYRLRQSRLVRARAASISLQPPNDDSGAANPSDGLDSLM